MWAPLSRCHIKEGEMDELSHVCSEGPTSRIRSLLVAPRETPRLLRPHDGRIVDSVPSVRGTSTGAAPGTCLTGSISRVVARRRPGYRAAKCKNFVQRSSAACCCAASAPTYGLRRRASCRRPCSPAPVYRSPLERADTLDSDHGRRRGVRTRCVRRPVTIFLRY